MEHKPNSIFEAAQNILTEAAKRHYRFIRMDHNSKVSETSTSQQNPGDVKRKQLGKMTYDELKAYAEKLEKAGNTFDIVNK